MREVSCRMMMIIVRALQKRGLPEEEILAGIPYPLSHLNNKHERISWADFIQLMQNARKVWTRDEDFIEFGRSAYKAPIFRPISIIARQLYDVRDIYFWLTAADGPGSQMFTCHKSRCRDLDGNRIEYHLALQDGYPFSREFFLITQGGFEQVPSLVGLPPSVVHSRETMNGIVYTITFPQSRALFVKLRKGLAWLFSARGAAQALEESQIALEARYRELEAAREQVDHQAMHLRTASRITQVVHGDRGLPRTLEAIASTLVDIGGCAAVELAISTHVEGQAIIQKTRKGSAASGTESLDFSLIVRDEQVGTLRIWQSSQARNTPAYVREISEFIIPTVCMALGDSLVFTAVTNYRNELESRVVKRTAELQQARDSLAGLVEDLRQAQAARDRIFANINHEIRTPLSFITLATAEIRARSGNALDEQARDVTTAIDQSVHRLMNLVDGLLLLAAGQEGKLLLRPVRCDVALLLQQAKEVWATAARAAELTLHYDGPGRFEATLDVNALERLLSNLLSNAIKFTLAGGSILLCLVPGESHFQLIVRDTGVGLEEEFLSRIFGRFEQGRRVARGGLRGSGIGLSLVKELVLAHGGTIEASNNSNGGASFVATMPRVAQALPISPGSHDHVVPLQGNTGAFGLAVVRRQSRETPVPRQATSATILVAEDDPMLRDALVRLLSETYRVIAAPDGITALSLAQQHVPDMLLSDVEMPGMNGIELCRRFRDLPGNRLAATLLLTAHGNLQARLSGFEAGATDYITKPFAPEELLARVRAQLELRHMALRLNASEKLASLGTMAAGLAHELRNPANAVVNAIDPLVQSLPAEVLLPGSAAHELLSVVREGAEQLRALAQQLLGFVRPGDLARKPERIEELVDRALAVAGEPLRERRIVRQLNYKGTAFCAAPLIVQVLCNLFENAGHATRPGDTVTIAVYEQDSAIVMDVTDSGPGVPHELRERIFMPFFTTKDPGKGTGLGLSTARIIAERHQGRLHVIDSSPGATFRLELPRDGAPS